MPLPLGNDKAEFSVRPYREGDEPVLVEGFNAVFGTHRTLAHWQWKFGRNPYSPPIVSVGTDSTGKLVGQVATVPVRINLSGESTFSGHIVDLYVRPAASHGGFFSQGTRQIEALCHERGMEILYTFPNPNAFPGFLRLDWTRVGFLKEYAKRLSIRDTLTKVVRPRALAAGLDALFHLGARAVCGLQGWMLRHRTGKALRFSVSELLPEGYEALWATVKTQEAISVWKDADYMRWRYDDHPDRDFTYFALHEGTDLIALAVACANDNQLMITELMVSSHEVTHARWLLNRVVSHAARRRYARVMFAGNDGGFFESAFRDFASVASFARVFCAKGLAGREIGMAQAVNWTITLGDGDAF